MLHGPADLILDIVGHTAFIGETEVPLTSSEFELMALLLERRGRAVPISAIAAHVSEGAFDRRRNFLEAIVSRLRIKLRAAGAEGVVETVRQVGYKMS